MTQNIKCKNGMCVDLDSISNEIKSLHNKENLIDLIDQDLMEEMVN